MRRLLLTTLIVFALPLVRTGENFGLALHAGSPALAKEGGSDGGGDGGGSGSDGGSGGSGSGGSGSDGGDDGGGSNSGSGDDGGDDGDNSGHGGGDDDDDGDDHRGSDDDDDEDRGFFGGLFGGDRADSGGEGRTFRRGEIVGYDLTAEERAELSDAGFRPVAEYQLSALGRTVTRMRVPLGLSSREGLAAAEARAPGAVLELNHLYASEGHGCAPDACWPADLVGFDPLQDGACAGTAPIAIIDTAVDRLHPALAGADIVARDFVDGGAERGPTGHGTAISALLVGHPGAARPLVPGGELLVAEAFGREDEGPRADAVAVLRGLDWAIASGAKVVGLSLAGAANRVLERGIEAAARQALLVAAAGNDGPDGAAAYPAAYPGVIAVAAVDARQRPYRRGTRGAYVDISAPGVKIRSADANGGTTEWTGTSFSVPFVMTALVRASAETGGDRAAARSLVDAMARDLGAPGRDDVYGVGLVQSPGHRCR